MAHPTFTEAMERPIPSIVIEHEDSEERRLIEHGLVQGQPSALRALNFIIEALGMMTLSVGLAYGFLLFVLWLDALVHP